jgi:hypothetical protein
MIFRQQYIVKTITDMHNKHDIVAVQYWQLHNIYMTVHDKLHARTDMSNKYGSQTGLLHV